jgi:predicted flap endonuclease-1-like 5' DNA nuclease
MSRIGAPSVGIEDTARRGRGQEGGMTSVGGMIWWIVLGAFLGWVVAWWIGRSSQRLLTEPVLQIVERRVDNPQHVARIASLEGQVATVRELEQAVATIPALQARIDELVAAPPRIVEKVITRTVDRVIEKPVERIVEKLVEKPVERIVDRPVPVPDTAALAERDAALRVQRQRVEHLDALAAVLADRLATVMAATAAPAAQPSAAVEPAAIGIAAFAPAPLAPAAIATARADTPAADTVRPLRARIEHLEALAAVQADRLAEARRLAQAGFVGVMPGADADIEIVEGIGPRIAQLLRARGLGSFGALAQASPGTLREILDDNGPAYRIADPTTWPEQARLAADGRWDELRSLQDSLNAGRR